MLIYRLKEDLRQLGIAFPQREVEPVRIPAPVKGTPELELAAKLEDYCSLREERLRDQPLKVRNASAFLKSGLQQRLLSSVEAFWRTLNKHNQTIQEQLHRHGRLVTPDRIELDEQELSAIGSGVDADEEADEVIETTDPSTSTTESTPPATGEDPRTAEAERQTEKATLATLGDPNHPNFAREMKLLDEMMTTADRARHSPDEKLKKLFEYIERHMLEPTPRGSATGRGWTAHRILIFTEYDDTLAYVRRHLEAFIQSTSRSSERLAIYKGSTSLEERQEIKEAFNSDPAAHPVRILLATDAAREGINLQKYCFNLFHYDVPWNPARLEQRNGRIDRKLQPAPTVYCRYFLYENREEDAILRKIVEKTENIYRELGGFGTVLDKNLIQMLRRRGIDRTRVAETCGMLDLKDPEEEQRSALALVELSSDDELPDEPGPSTTEFDRDRIDRKRREKLDRSVQKLRQVMEESSRWLDFRESQFRASLDCALRLMEIEGGLTPESVERPKARRYFFPTASLEKNPTWRETINSLRAPRRRREELGAWYARCPVRPVVFEDPGVLQLGQPLSGANGEAAAEPVHMHLEHRISRRLLSRFQSQGFVYHDLSRACLTQTEGSLPLVYLLGRLCLYGHQAARLHEDLIAVCAEWIPPDSRRGPLKPIDKKKLSEEEAMRRLDEALLEADMSRITETRRQALLSAADRDVHELHEHLKKQSDNLERKVREDLTKAGVKEAENTRKLLEDLGKRIDERLERLQHEDETKHERARQRASKTGPTLFDLDEPPEPIWDERARRERAAEKRAMEQRKAAIPREIQEEPDRIRQRYSVQTVRLEPVGIVYLWPEKG